MESRIEIINNVEYEVFKFPYLFGEMNGEEYFILLDYDEVEGNKVFWGELYILIPSYVEIQDLFQMSSEKDIRTGKYEISDSKLKRSKMLLLCSKIIDHRGASYMMDKDFHDNLYPSFAGFIVYKIENVLDKYYIGSGLTKEREKQLVMACYKYYKAIYRSRAGHTEVIPPSPGIIYLMNVCEMFSCTPDVARKISKRDLDMIMIAREQKDICENCPSMIGM